MPDAKTPINKSKLISVDWIKEGPINTLRESVKLPIAKFKAVTNDKSPP
jgi:hypothetical protein